MQSFYLLFIISKHHCTSPKSNFSWWGPTTSSTWCSRRTGPAGAPPWSPPSSSAGSKVKWSRSIIPFNVKCILSSIWTCVPVLTGFNPTFRQYPLVYFCSKILSHLAFVLLPSVRSNTAVNQSKVMCKSWRMMNMSNVMLRRRRTSFINMLHFEK